MIKSLLFVGRTKGRVRSDELDLGPAIKACTSQFGGLKITGGLLIADSYLAHLIEGTDEAIEGARENCQPACVEVGAVLVREETIAKRRFAKWTLVYAGGTAYVAERVRSLVTETMTEEQRSEKAQELVQIMQLFAGG